MSRIRSTILIIASIIALAPVALAQMPGQPANSYVYGNQWFCNNGYVKRGNRCVSIFADMPSGQPANSYVYGDQWFCSNGYEKRGNQCVSIFAGMPSGQPANSYVYGDQWFCSNGYEKRGNQCVSIFAGMPSGQPANSYVYGDQWFCNNGYEKRGNQCVSIFAGMPSAGAPPPPKSAREPGPPSQPKSPPTRTATAPAAAQPMAWPSWQASPSPVRANPDVQARSPREVYRTAAASVYAIVAALSESHLKSKADVNLGSAVAVSAQTALTNCHVLDDRPYVMLIQGKQTGRASLVHADQKNDRCIIKSETLRLTPVVAYRSHESLQVGEKVYTVGSPQGLESTLGEGLVSGLRTLRGLRLVQTTAAISPGSSGGGLFDEAANLVGITSFMLRDSQSLNFAISAEEFWRQ